MNSKNIFIGFSLISASILVVATDYSEDKLYGNKTANLAYSSKNIEMLNSIGIKVAIPDFFGISDQEIKTFLNESYEDIKNIWEIFIEVQAQKEDLTESGKQALAIIRKRIAQRFNESDFALENGRHTELTEFLATISLKNDARLMVRSSGREDTNEMANAGGNDTIANVLPDLDELRLAIPKVLQSYFSEKSFEQRIAAGESPESLFKEPFMPVLLQYMITEDESGEIPVSGVAFSREPYANTKGVVAINSTFGHGETVVNSIYPVDSYFVTKLDIVYPILRAKHTRLKPKENGSGLEPAKNSSTDKIRPSLSKTQAINIKKMALALEQERDEAVDIEFVIFGDIIYIVQVRPIIMAENNPKYLSDEAFLSIEQTNKLSMSTIVSGGSELKQLNNSNEIIITERLSQALAKYLSLNHQERDAIKLIISGEQAAFNSHEATTFRANNKAVVYVKDLAKAKTMIKNRGLIADVQRGVLCIKPDLNPDDLKSGWLEHPIPTQLTIHPDFFLSPYYDMPGKISQFKIDRRHSNLQLLESIYPQYLEDPKDLEHEIMFINQFIYNFSPESINKKNLSNEVRNNPKFKGLVNLIKRQANILQIHIKTNDKDDALAKLLAIKFLKTLLLQSYDLDILSPWSLASVVESISKDKKMADKLGIDFDSGSYFIEFAKLENFAFTDFEDGNNKDNWKFFLKKWHQEQPENYTQEFSQIIRELVRLDLVPLWINVSFQTSFKSWSDVDLPATKLVQDLLADFATNKDVLTDIKECKSNVKSFAWSDFSIPKKVKKSLKDFQNQLLNPILRSLIGTYDKQSPLAKAAILALMQDLLVNFDDAIKAQSRSNEYASTISKANDFASMLEIYFQWLESMVNNLLSQEDYESLWPNGIDHKNGYLGEINDIFYKAREFDSEEQAIMSMQATAEFNVDGAKLSSKASFYRSIGNNDGNKRTAKPSLEDVFTLIHQNLLVVISQKSSREFGDDLRFPLIVSELKNNISKNLSGIDFVGLDLDKNALKLFFNQSLRIHSSSYEIIYDFRSKKTRLKSKFIGQARSRWSTFAGISSSLLHIINFSAPFVDTSKGSLELDWQIGFNNISKAISYLKKFGDLSLVSDNSFLDGAMEFIKTLIPKDAHKKRLVFEQLCEDEIWNALENNINADEYIRSICREAGINDINKRFYENLKEKMNQLAENGQGSLFLQYFDLSRWLFETNREQKHELLDALVMNDKVSDWSQVYYIDNYWNRKITIFSVLVSQSYPVEKIIYFIKSLPPEIIPVIIDNDEGNILHHAVNYENSVLISYLVDNFSSLKNKKNNNNKTPLDLINKRISEAKEEINKNARYKEEKSHEYKAKVDMYISENNWHKLDELDLYRNFDIVKIYNDNIEKATKKLELLENIRLLLE